MSFVIGVQSAVEDYRNIISSNAKPTLGSVRQNELSQLMAYSQMLFYMSSKSLDPSKSRYFGMYYLFFNKYP